MSNDMEWFLQTDGRYQSESDLSIITDPIEEAIFQEGGYTLINLRLGIGPASGSWKLLGYVNNAGNKEYRTTVRNDGTFGPPSRGAVAVLEVVDIRRQQAGQPGFERW